ncbi:MAG: hypothetical protein K8U57_37150 [Planctomycetes bacterium]|nr:hypothetical protein [Planctomycetota bacterium]
MPVATLPHPRTPRNAPHNARVVAEKIRDGANVTYPGRQHSPNQQCSMCGRAPRGPLHQLFCVELDSVTNDTVLLGVGVCHRRILGAAIRRLIAEEQALNDPARAAGIGRLQAALTQLT